MLHMATYLDGHFGPFLLCKTVLSVRGNNTLLWTYMPPQVLLATKRRSHPVSRARRLPPASSRNWLTDFHSRLLLEEICFICGQNLV